MKYWDNVSIKSIYSDKPKTKYSLFNKKSPSNKNKFTNKTIGILTDWGFNNLPILNKKTYKNTLL